MDTIRKVKFNNGKVTVEYDHEGAQITVVAEAAPHPDFTQTLSALSDDVHNICELPRTTGSGVRVTGLSIKHEEERRGFIISGVRTLAHRPQTHALSTPLVWDNHKDAMQALSDDDAIARMNRVIEEAKFFLGGKRAQADMFAEEPEEIKPADIPRPEDPRDVDGWLSYFEKRTAIQMDHEEVLRCRAEFAAWESGFREEVGPEEFDRMHEVAKTLTRLLKETAPSGPRTAQEIAKGTAAELVALFGEIPPEKDVQARVDWFRENSERLRGWLADGAHHPSALLSVAQTLRGMFEGWPQPDNVKSKALVAKVASVGNDLRLIVERAEFMASGDGQASGDGEPSVVQAVPEITAEAEA